MSNALHCSFEVNHWRFSGLSYDPAVIITAGILFIRLESVMEAIPECMSHDLKWMRRNLSGEGTPES